MSVAGGAGVRLVLMGAPGVGKGTQAAEITRRVGLPHISTGDLLRAAIRDGSPLGRKVAPIVERGDLVPDALIGEVMEERLARKDAAGGFLLDGFPRTVAQADLLDRILARRGQALDRVISIEVPEPEIIERLVGRRLCGRCGATYHVRFQPPKGEGLCDRCRGGRGAGEQATPISIAWRSGCAATPVSVRRSRDIAGTPACCAPRSTKRSCMAYRRRKRS